MKKHFLVVLLFSSFVSCFISLHVFAAQTDCPVQLALTDRSGTPVTTSVDYEVHFYSAASGGSELVTAQTGTDTPTDGVLVIPVTCSASLLNHSGIFLEFIINGETMSPRVEMASSPFAGTAFAVAGDAITSTQIFDGTIAAADMASNSITSTKILDGTITTTDIADDSVTSAKIFDGTIVAADLAANSVSGTAIIDNTIDGNDIGFHVLDFTSLANILALDADRTLNQSTFRWTQNFTGTTGPAINLTSSGAVSTGSSAAMNLRVSNAATSVNAVTINNGGIGNSFAVTNGAGADPYYFLIDPTGNVAVGKSTTASRFVVAPPVAETITNGTTVTANACGTIKRIVTLGINIDTDATNTFTAPSDALAGCCMDIVNVGSFNLNFKHNANFMTSGGGDQTLGPDDTMRVCCTGAGGKWYQVSISTNG